jgi:hypothetical protein
VPGGAGTEPAAGACSDVLLKRCTGDLGDRRTPALSLVAQPSVEIIRQLCNGVTSLLRLVR